MADPLKFKFSQGFTGTIWKMIAAPEKNLIFLEVRNGDTFQVEFSAFDYQASQFIWKDWRVKESWWISLTAANAQTLLLHTFVNKGNPDHKNLIACDIFNQTVRWEAEEFSFYDWNESEIKGYRTVGEITPAVINIESGIIADQKWEAGPQKQEGAVIRPVQYAEGTANFGTVQRFIQQRIDKTISGGAEYLEFDNWIIVSIYTREPEGLANYLIVMTQEGEIALTEKLGGKLEGLGVDTFFILSGCLFFVKNRQELVAYTFYD